MVLVCFFFFKDKYLYYWIRVFFYEMNLIEKRGGVYIFFILKLKERKFF